MKTERIYIRVTPAEKAKLAKAAKIWRGTLSYFIATASLNEADRSIEVGKMVRAAKLNH